jgi:Zn-dependent peptidase ImmA (M78 family)
MTSLGNHIRQLREAYSFDPTRLAKLAFMSVARVVEVEGGAVTSTAELSRLANALAVDPSALYAGKIQNLKRTVARFRAPIGLANLNGSDARLLARATEVGGICGELRKLTGKGPSPVIARRSPIAVGPAEPWRQGYDLGKTAREAFFSSHGALESVQGSLEELGVHVAFVHFEAEGIEAASLLGRNSNPVILLNKSSPRIDYPLSRRAILAHELCHLLHDGGERDLAIISREEHLDNSGEERRANGFAPNFLAPKDWVTFHTKNPKAIVTKLAEDWGLSLEGAAWHAKNLGLVEESKITELRETLSKSTFKTRFEAALPRTPPDLVGIDAAPTDLTLGYLSNLVAVAAEEGSISKGRAAEILTMQ